MIENLKDEIWMTHPIFTDYAASNYGRIKSLERDVVYKNGAVHHYEEKLIKLSLTINGYLQFHIWKNGKGLGYKVHRFCYEAFHKVILPKGMKELQINHIDENRINNCIENLELCTPQYNVDYSVSKAVGQYTLEGELVKIWKSTIEAQRESSYYCGHISECCNGKRNFYKGFKWKYIE